MTAKTLAKLVSLYPVCLGIVFVAGASGSELYIFFLSKRHPRPPSNPWAVAFFLLISGVMFPWSNRHALYCFSLCTLLVMYSSPFAWFVFSWHPTWAQCLLTITMIATSVYGWRLWEDHMND